MKGHADHYNSPTKFLNCRPSVAGREKMCEKNAHFSVGGVRNISHFAKKMGIFKGMKNNSV
jgi:hypothetical protein